MKLNIGSGLQHIEGYTSVDPYAPADISTVAWSLPLEDASVEAVYASHMLEHLSYAETEQTLKEWLRVLQPGGTLTVVIPNMSFVAAVWLHGGDRVYRRQIMFGSQQHEGEYHRNGWSDDDIRADLEDAGFTVTGIVTRWTPEYSQESIIVEATK